MFYDALDAYNDLASFFFNQKVKNGWSLKTEDLRSMALEVVPKFGFYVH